MRTLRALIYLFLQTCVLGSAALVAGVSGAILYLEPTLPSVQSIRDIQLQTPMKIYSRDGKLIAEFGEKKRSPVSIDKIPPQLISAFLAAEDARFYEHSGVDLKSLSRAFSELASSGKIKSGGSTITMQLAKNYFLSSERTFLRKGKEVLLALRLEQTLTKQEILELYFNKIYLGSRAYGIAAAAQVYYGVGLEDLSIAQCATLAGLPKAPSANNPVSNPKRAIERRNWILSRMFELGMLNRHDYEDALKAPNNAYIHSTPLDTDAPYLAEMARQFAVDKFGESSYETGLKVYTTAVDDLQRSADKALRSGILAYDRRHGYRGPEQHIGIDGLNLSALQAKVLPILAKTPPKGGLEAAVVVDVSAKSSRLLLASGATATLTFEEAKWARKLKADGHWAGGAPTRMSDIVTSGDLVRLEPGAKEGSWKLAQLPQVQSALISLDSNSGAVLAVTGGFDFQSSKFNRAIQGGRQPGSSFKPFIYTAALSGGMTPASIINDAPLVFEDPTTGQVWRPQNHSGEYLGPIRLREALFKSKNLVSIRILQEMGVPKTLEYLRKFSFDPTTLPPNLSLALGTGIHTPMQMATGYAVFSNGGYKVEPWWVSRIENEQGQVLYKANPLAACITPCRRDDSGEEESPLNTKASPPRQASALTDPSVEFRQAERVEEERIIWLITDMMKDVIRQGTARKALELKRDDLAGKTGTTNDQKDAWFSGFNPEIVASVWVGFDTPQGLGNTEFGGTAALPIWIDYMRDALKERPQMLLPPPEGLISVKIDPTTGLLASPEQTSAMFETFQKEHVPDLPASSTIMPGSPEELSVPEQLF